MVELLRDYEILESPPVLPEAIRRHGRGQRPLQLAKRIVRLVPAKHGWRCRKCSIWRPYCTDVCLTSTVCSGHGEDLQPSTADRETYYVRLYTADRPRRLRAMEHTAQIDQDTRAKREQEFKDGKLEVLVCSPTLELGVDIGPLYSVLLRNAPPTPANYVQRGGRAGRRLRIGFITTFCGTGPHDRHCFEDPAWLVRGEFKPPVVRMTNEKILARHVRSFALEELNEDFSWLMGDLLADIQNPEVLKRDRYAHLLDRLRAQRTAIAAKVIDVFGNKEHVATVVADFPNEFERTVARWHEQVKRLRSGALRPERSSTTARTAGTESPATLKSR